jgi:hypothetical protein
MITKEQYINLRNSKTLDVIYYYYREHHVPEKHIGPFDIQEFFIYLNMWGNMQQIAERVINHYDQKFNIVILSDAKGNIIKYL